MKKLTNLLWGVGFIGIASLGLINLPENKPTKIGKTQLVSNQQVKNPEKENYWFLLSMSLLYSGGVGIFSRPYIKESYF